jgi:membrane dipeptidase
MSDISATEKARALLQDSLICDMLFAPGPNLGEEIRPFVDARFSAVSLSMAGDANAWPTLVFQKIAQTRRHFSRNPDQFLLADSVADIKRAKAENKMAVLFHFQGTEAVARDLSLVGAYYKLGVKWMLMAYNHQNSVGMGCIEAQSRDLGLSEFGRDLVAEMNRVGMIVDCSHSGHRTTMDAMELSTAPCIFSHSNVHALYDHPRNIKDDQIKACAQTGGVIGLNGVGSFVGEAEKVTAETLFSHLDHICELVGPQHAALGLDYMSPTLCAMVIARLEGDISKVGMMPPPWCFFHPTELVDLVALMVKHGYPEEDIRGILGLNFLRVAEQVWK